LAGKVTSPEDGAAVAPQFAIGPPGDIVVDQLFFFSRGLRPRSTYVPAAGGAVTTAHGAQAPSADNA